LQHNYYTDIITFDLSETSVLITGEIYISTDRVRDNAIKLGVSFKEEIHRVIFHGALHLCGYKDKTPRHVREMRAAEDSYLELYFR
jgi:rRNA maturation RNase YbeY